MYRFLVFFLLVSCGSVAVLGSLAAYESYQLTQSSDLVQVREFLAATIERDSPDAEWTSSFQTGVPSDRLTAHKVFFSFKVWFAENGVTTQELRQAQATGSQTRDGAHAPGRFDDVEIDYRPPLPIIGVRIVHQGDAKGFFPRFPLNNCLFQPDQNGDGVLDMQDVELARIRHADQSRIELDDK